MATASGPKCECGAATTRDVRERLWICKGKPLFFDQPGWYCTANATHDVVMDETDTMATQPLLLAHRVVVEGGMHPNEIRRIRKKLGISQRQAGRIVGGGPIAFHKYEKGEVATSHAVGALLKLLDSYPELLADLGVGKLVGEAAIAYAKKVGAAVYISGAGRKQTLVPGKEDAAIAKRMAGDPRCIRIDVRPTTVRVHAGESLRRA